MSGPSHQYDQYKQQTGIVPGALATTFAVNQNNNDVAGYTGFDLEGYLGGLDSPEDLMDFGAAPTQTSPNMGTEFGFFESTVDPTAIESMASPVPTTGNVGRLWPGMHQQAALAKARAQQRQQQQIIQQQRQAVPKPVQRAKGPQPTDPIVEQKITQLLNSMRAKSGHAEDDDGNSPMMNMPRLKKDEDDMDEDERLLASEEGKKLSSKEPASFETRCLLAHSDQGERNILRSLKPRLPTRSPRIVISRLTTVPFWRRTVV